MKPRNIRYIITMDFTAKIIKCIITNEILALTKQIYLQERNLLKFTMLN